MSETVHYRGVAREIKATKTETVEQVAEKICGHLNIKMNEYVVKYKESSWSYLLSDNLYQKYTLIKGVLYGIEKEDVDIYDEIIKAERLPNGDTSFELKYYNGGAGFEECLEEAFNRLENKTK